MAQDRMKFGINDYEPERSSVSIGIENVTTSNITAILLASASLRSAMEAITLGQFVDREITISQAFASASTPATNPAAERENKWLVTYEDITEYSNAPTNTVFNQGYRKVFTLELPTADVGIRINNDNVIYKRGADTPIPNLPDAETFVTALEAILKSPYGGEASVLKIEAVGRNI